MSIQQNEYLVPSGYGEAELIEKKSRFIGRVWPAQNEAEAQEYIAQMRKQHWDATHNVFAYIVQNGAVVRFSDDGEPQGTSGLPALNVFKSESVFNVCCVVTRYFGGTLLGAGGLVRAYSKSAKMALNAAGIALLREWNRILIETPYNVYEKIRSAIEMHSGIIDSTQFTANVLIEALLPAASVDKFCRAVCDVSSGTVVPVVESTVLRSVKIR